MDLLQLEHFLAVAEEGSFTRAAERVFRTQPAVSQSVKKLETEIGVPLFARDLPDLTLTEAGHSLLDYARKIVKLRDEAVKQVGRLHALDSGHLTIAAYESAALYLLPGPLRRYFRQFPQIKVGIYRGRLDEIPRQVMDREIDVGFVKDEPAFHGLRSVMVHSDEMILIASPRHPLTARERVQVKDLGNEPFVLHHLCSTTEQKILRLFESHNVRCNIAAELWSFENVKHFVQQDIGLAIVPRVTVLQDLAAGTLVSIPMEGLDIPRRTLMIFRDRGYVSDSAQQFIDVVKRFNWETWLPQPAPSINRAQAVVRDLRPARLKTGA
jgi:DNA-binding transcriptional LysR family regulator